MKEFFELSLSVIKVELLFREVRVVLFFVKIVLVGSFYFFILHFLLLLSLLFFLFVAQKFSNLLLNFFLLFCFKRRVTCTPKMRIFYFE